MLFSPLGSEFSGEGFIKDGGLTGSKAVQYILHLLLGLIQLDKQAFNTVNNALLLCKRWDSNRNSCRFPKRIYGIAVPNILSLLKSNHLYLNQ